MQVSSHVLEPSADYPFYITAKCYTPAQSDEAGATLVVTHASGMHKECWEPALERLMDGEGTRIREAWAIESPNHGESAALNEKQLEGAWLEVFPWDDYGRAVGRFLQAGPDKGAKVDFSKRKLWALGHSMGAVAMIWLHQTPEYSITFDRLILVDPMLQPPRYPPNSPPPCLLPQLTSHIGFDLRKSTAYFFPATYQRRDVWPSRAAALKDFKSGRGYARWDPRVLELFVQYALKSHPASRFAVAPWDGVVLACGRAHEAACYRGGEELIAALVPKLAEMARSVPVSVIFGVIEDSVPRKMKEALADPAISGVEFASVHWVQDAGHLVVQNSPAGLAQEIIGAIDSKGPVTGVKSKL